MCALFTLLICFVLITPAQLQDPLTVQAAEIEKWCHYLASDDMKGRQSGSPEMKEAAEWIAGQFKEAGLFAFSEHPNYFQEYDFERRSRGTIHERNVLGFIPGGDLDLKDEYVVITAHYDHVGFGRPVNGDSIYNGANDNAAGTVTLIAVAHAFKRLEVQPARSIIFLAVSGEEMGMRGSRHFMSDPPINPADIFLNLNFEMTGHCTLLGPKHYYITGASFTNFDDILDEYNEISDWTRVDTIRNADMLFFASDNVSFAVDRSDDGMKLNIPGFTFCTHGGEDHIHRPHDEPQFMDYNNMADLVDYLTGVTHYFSQFDGKINWDNEAFEKAMQGRRR